MLQLHSSLHDLEFGIRVNEDTRKISTQASGNALPWIFAHLPVDSMTAKHLMEMGVLACK